MISELGTKKLYSEKQWKEMIFSMIFKSLSKEPFGKYILSEKY